jgi:hypothetical protein
LFGEGARRIRNRAGLEGFRFAERKSLRRRSSVFSMCGEHVDPDGEAAESQFQDIAAL